MCSRVARRSVAAAAMALMLASGNALAADGDAKPESAEGAKAELQNEETAKLEQAAKAIEQLNYTEARQLLLGVVQSGHATSEQLAKAYFSIGECEAALGNDVEATDAFYLALMIQPATLFPAGGSPKIRQRLNEARSRVTEVGVLEASARLEDGVLDVRLRNDPLQLVKNIEVLTTRAGGDVGRAKLDRKASRVEIESDVQTIRVLLHDEAGNELKAIDVDPASKTGGAPSSIADGKPSVWTHWGLWAGVAGAFAIGGTYFTIEASKLDQEARDAANADPPNQPEASNLEERRDRTALYGVIGFSLAGAAAVTAGALLFFQDDDAPKPASDDGAATSARLVPTAGPGQIGAEFSMRF